MTKTLTLTIILGLCAETLLAQTSTSVGDRLVNHHWVVDEKGKSSVDGSGTVLFTVMGTCEGASDSAVPLLMLAWTQRHWTVVLYPANEDLKESPTITLRRDQQAEEKVTWLSSADRKKAFAPSPAEFVARLMNTDKLWARAVTSSDKPGAAFLFDVSGLKTELEKYPEARKSLDL